VPTADRGGNSDRWRHYYVRPIDRCWRERAGTQDDLSGPRQCGSRPRHWAAALVQESNRAQAWKPPPRGSPPRPLSCAKAATQIRTDSPIISFTSTYLAKSRPLNLLHAMRQLKPADLFGCEQNVLFAPGHAVLGVLTHALSRAGLGSPCALQSIRRANWLFLLVLLPDLAAQAADVCNPTDLVGPYARAPWWPHASLPMQGATLWRVTCIGKAYEEARR